MLSGSLFSVLVYDGTIGINEIMWQLWLLFDTWFQFIKNMLNNTQQLSSETICSKLKNNISIHVFKTFFDKSVGIGFSFPPRTGFKARSISFGFIQYLFLNDCHIFHLLKSHFFRRFYPKIWKYYMFQKNCLFS